MADLEKLKELAEAAGSQTPPAFWTDGAGERERTWSEFYANANPAAILALISRLEEAEKENAKLREINFDLQSEDSVSQLCFERVTAQRDEAVEALGRELWCALANNREVVVPPQGQAGEIERLETGDGGYVLRRAQDVVARIKGGE